MKKLDRRIYIGLFLSIVLIVVIIMVISNWQEKNPLLHLIYDPESPIAIYKGGKFGYIDNEGNILIEPQFESAEQFYGNYAVVSQLADEEEIYEIIDRAGNIVLTSTSANRPRYYSNYGVWLIDNRLYSKEMQEIFEENYHMAYVSKGYFSFLDNAQERSGIIDYQGKTIYSWDENYISIDISEIAYAGAELYAAVSNYEEREEIIALKDGKNIFKLDDPKNQYLEVEDDNVFRVISREDNYKTIRWLYIDHGEIAYESDDDIYSITVDNFQKRILKIDYGVNFELLGKSKRYAYYDTKNAHFMDEKYEKEESINKNDWMKDIYGYKTYTCSGLTGLMVKDKVLLDCTNTEISFLKIPTYEYLVEYHKTPIAIVKNDTKIDIYNMKKKKAVESFEVASVLETDESTFLLITEFAKDGFTKQNYVIYNFISGMSKKFTSSDDIAVYSNYITVADGTKRTYYNTDLKEIFEGDV